MYKSKSVYSAAMLCLILFMGGCGMVQTVDAANEAMAPEVPREFRGVWVATVSRIDWPPQAGTEEQKQAMLDILDMAAEMNLNAVVFQVRPAADALYESEIEPWSRYLTGTPGKAPEPYYDPLEFAVEEAHKRGLELHAWFNPYRAGLSESEDYADSSIVTKRPDLVRKHGKQKWMDPAEPEVQEQSLKVMLDVAERYDVDAIHMDDYFYPYGAGDGFDDEKTWKAYQDSGGTLSRSDWRRKNVDDFIQKLSEELRKVKPHVKLGISPFGIWRPGHPAGIVGMDQYNSIFADPKKWLEEGWVDYLTPQLYWPIDSTGQPFVPLLTWWTQQNPKGRHVWPGLFTSKYDREEIGNQVKESRKILGDTAGHIHFSQKSFRSDDGKPYIDTIYAKAALVPEATWIQSEAPMAPKATLTTVADGSQVCVDKESLADARLWVVQYQTDGEWDHKLVPASELIVKIPEVSKAVVFSVNRLGKSSPKSQIGK